MTPSRVSLYLWTTSAALALASAATVAWAVLGPYDAPAAEARAHPGAKSTSAATTPTDPALVDFSKVWDINLRRPLIDRPPAAVVAAAAPIAAHPPVAVKLVGTVIEPGHSIAIFVRPDGKTEVKGVGESVASDQVLEIRAESVTLRHGTESVVLHREKLAKVTPPPKRIMPLRKPSALIVLRHGGGWTLCAEGLAPASAQVKVAPGATPAEAARALADALEGLNRGGSDLLLGLPSQSCFCAPVAAGDTARKNKRGPLIFRLEEKLPMAAEDFAADFILRDDGALGVCAAAADVAPAVDALESAGMRVDRISPALLLALQSLPESATACDAHLWGEGGQLDFVVMAGDRPQLWYCIAPNNADLAMYLQSTAAGRATPLRIALRNVPAHVAESVAKTPGVTIVSRSAETIAQAITSATGTLAGGDAALWIDLRRDTLAPPDAFRRFRRPLVGFRGGFALAVSLHGGGAVLAGQSVSAAGTFIRRRIANRLQAGPARPADSRNTALAARQ